MRPVISKGRCQGETMTVLDIAANCNPTRFLCFLFPILSSQQMTLYIGHGFLTFFWSLYSMGKYGSVWVLPSHSLRNCMKSSLVLAMRWCVSPILLSVMSVAGSAIGESITAGEFFQNHEKYDLAGSFLIWSQLGCERVSVVTHTHTSFWTKSEGAKGRSTCQTLISEDRILGPPSYVQ